jgi:NarL family two-component system response regulator LiaR
MSPDPGSNAANGPLDPARIGVLIVDDHAVVRQGLRTFLELQDDPSLLPIEIVGEATNDLEAVDLARRFQPDVVLLDLVMPGMDGYQATQQIKALCPSCRAVALTVHGDLDSQDRAAQAGVDVFLVKGASVEALMEAIAARA